MYTQKSCPFLQDNHKIIGSAIFHLFVLDKGTAICH